METVLVVEDSEVMRLRVSAALDSRYVVEVAASADEGLRLARAIEPDVIIVDFVLPDADGLVLMRELRRAGVEAPVIALTAASNIQIAYRFLHGGAADFLVKDGLKASDVRAAVRRALTLAKAGVRLRGPAAHEEPPEEGSRRARLDDPADGEIGAGPPLRVLVVDDTAVARAAVRGVLAREGWTVDEADDLRSALERARDSPPDVVLLDYLLPDVDGIEALRMLRNAGLRAPVIALTGHGSEDLAERFLRAGASDFLGKDDLSEERFVHAIRRAVAASAAFHRTGA